MCSGLGMEDGSLEIRDPGSMGDVAHAPMNFADLLLEGGNLMTEPAIDSAVDDQIVHPIGPFGPVLF